MKISRIHEIIEKLDMQHDSLMAFQMNEFDGLWPTTREMLLAAIEQAEQCLDADDPIRCPCRMCRALVALASEAEEISRDR